MKKRLSIQLCQKITDCKNDETKQSRLHSHWIILWSPLRHPKQFFLYDFSLLLPKLKEILYKSNFELKDRNKKNIIQKKQSPEAGVQQKSCLKKFRKIHKNTPESICLFFKQPATLLKRKFGLRCFLVGFLKFCGANQWTGFYMITASVMKGLICVYP